MARRKAILNEKAAIREAELRLREAIKQSKEEGKREGKREGRVEGKLEVARKLLNRGMDIQSISEIIDISEEEISNLR